MSTGIKKSSHLWVYGASLLLLFLAACQPPAPDVPTATPVVIAKYIATAYISPTPNSEQIAATRAVITPTLIPVTNTPIPSPTAYVGVFIGQAPREEGFRPITTPLFAGSVSSPTPDSTRCRTPVYAGYLVAWQTGADVSRSLGCPIQENFGFFGNVQVFETGAAYLNRDTHEVWFITTGSAAPHYWYQANPPSVPTGDVLPPPGLRVPTGDIGSLWAANDEIRQAVGFAQTGEQEIGINVQRYESGSFLLDASIGQFFGLGNDGSAFGPFDLPDELPTPAPADASVPTPIATASPPDQPPPLSTTEGQ
jgi:hypothetical protein